MFSKISVLVAGSLLTLASTAFAGSQSSIADLSSVDLTAKSFSITTSPGQRIISEPGRYIGSSANFVEFNDGSFEIYVRLRFQDGRSSDPAHLGTAFFKLNQGTLFREGNNLYWVSGNKKIHLAHHEWWYSAWILAENVQIKYDVNRIHKRSGWKTYRISTALEFSD